MNHRPDAARDLCAAVADIHRRGWCDGTGGNFSCVLARTPLRLLMAPSGVDKGTLQPEDLLVVDGTGAVVEGKGRPSAETPLHLAIVATTAAGAVLHTHSAAGTLVSRRPDRADLSHPETAGPWRVEVRGLEMLKGLEGITDPASSVHIPVLGNDQDLPRLARTAEPHLADAPHGLLIAGHGLYAWGRDLAAARRHLEVLEFLLEQKWRDLLLDAHERGGAQP